MPYFTYHNKKIHFRLAGKGEPLVILPGNTSSSAAHVNDIQFFADYYQVLSIDFLGTGNSDRTKFHTSQWWEEGAEQLNQLLQHLEKKQANIIGTSGGAIIGLLLAAKYPDKVKALIADSFSSKFTPDMFERNIVHPRSNPGEMQKQFWHYCHGTDWQEVIDQDTKLFQKLIEEGGDWLNDYPKHIQAPVLLTGSLKDSFLPSIEEDYQKIYEMIPSCEVFLNNGGDHPLIWTDSNAFRKKSLEFLSSCVPV
jgi:pimeloyl-ACP methyl ester carboxylesterase